MNSATNEQRLAAFELGIRLNQLRWYRTQALVTACTHEIQAVTDLLQSLPLLFVMLFPSEDGGELRGNAKEYERCWRNILFDEELDRLWKNIHWDIFRRGFRLALDDAFLQLQQLVPDYAEDLRRNLLDALGDRPDVMALLNLGSKIDQRRHPLEMFFQDFMHMDHEDNPCMLSTRPATGQLRGFNGGLSFEPPCEWPFRPFPSGKFHPDEDDWHLQLCIVWKNALPGFGEPESPVTKNANCTEVDEWTERQIGTIKRRICEPMEAGRQTYAASLDEFAPLAKDPNEDDPASHKPSGGSPDKVPSQPGGAADEESLSGEQPSMTLAKLPTRFRNAYRAYKWAEFMLLSETRNSKTKMSDHEVFDYLDNNRNDLPAEFGKYKLPSSKTFMRYCQEARGQLGENKNQRRDRRLPNGKSIINCDQFESHGNED